MSFTTQKLGELIALVDDANNIAGFVQNGKNVFFARPVGAIPAAAAHTGSTTKTKVGSIVIQGGIMGANGMLRVTPMFSQTSNANVKTVTYELSGTSIGTQALASAASNATPVHVRNKGSQNAQASSVGTLVAQSALTLDMSSDKTLDIFVTLATASDSVTFLGALVEVIPAE